MTPLLDALVAQTSDAPAQSPLGGLGGFMPFLLIAVVFYFVFFRPQAKQAKAHNKFVSELKKGDEVLTQGGMIGVIHAVDDRTVTLDVGAGTKVRIVKSQVSGPWKAEAPARAEARK
jgi:preprotein translocase subunit YajC